MQMPVVIRPADSTDPPPIDCIAFQVNVPNDGDRGTDDAQCRQQNATLCNEGDLTKTIKLIKVSLIKLCQVSDYSQRAP